MRREWGSEDLIECWTLADGDRRLVGNKTGPTRRGFALMLKFFEIEARFPRHGGEVPEAAVGYVADQIEVAPEEFASYDLAGRSAKYHRAQVREAFGFREASRSDEEALVGWLAAEVCPVELNDERVREALLGRCRFERIEPPGRIARIVGAARADFERRFCERTAARLSDHSVAKLEALVAGETHDDEGAGGADAGNANAGSASERSGAFAELKADPGRLGLETLLKETDKLGRVRAIGLPEDLFADASDKLVAAWRTWAAREYPAWMRKHPRDVRLTLLAALCWTRAAEITDALVELLVALVHKIDAHAEKRVEAELVKDLKRVRGKQGILFSLAEAAVDHPDETVRRALFPVVGEGTLRELVREAKADKRAFDARVRTVLRSSYSGHYRRGLPGLLAALEFRSNNAAQTAECTEGAPADVGGLTEVKISRSSPPVRVTAPAASKGRRRSATRLSGTTRGASAAAPSTIGTLIQKTHSHPGPPASTPPAMTPTIDAMPDSEPKAPSALLRSAPSAKVLVRIERAAGAMSAAPKPCRPHAAMRTAPPSARPDARDARANATKPARNTRRRPKVSASRPPRRRNPPSTVA